MPWKRRSPLWPLVGALVMLLALAVDAPRSWRRPVPTGLSSQSLPGIDTPLWTPLILQPDSSTAEPIDSIASPVVAPVLPPIEADSYSLEDFDFSGSAVSEKLPTRRPFDLQSLLKIQDQLVVLVGRLSAGNRAPVAHYPTAIANGVQVSSSHDRLAMRTVERRNPRTSQESASRTDEQKDFTDVLLESVRRSRAAAQDQPQPVRVAKRVESSTQIPTVNNPLAAETPTTEVPGAAEVGTDATPLAKPLLRYAPKSLISQLEAVPNDSPAADWAEQTLSLISRLSDDSTTDVAEAPAIVARLLELVASANSEAQQLADYEMQHRWMRGIQAVERRAVIWASLFDPQLRALETSWTVPSGTEAAVMAVLGDLAARLSGESNGEAWSEYLLLDHVATAASEGAGIDTKGRRKLAQEVLSRLLDKRLTTAQRDFVQTVLLVKLREVLRPWAMGPVDMKLWPRSSS